MAADISNEATEMIGRVFHPFSRLPTELRLQIWEASMETREIACSNYEEVQTGKGMPANMKACKEARDHLQQLYGKVRVRLEYYALTRMINLDSDCLRINNRSVSHVLQNMEIATRRTHLIVECANDDDNAREELLDSCTYTFSKFRGLKRLTLVHLKHKVTLNEPPSTHPYWGWKSDFMPLMREAYYTCTPVSYEIEFYNPYFPEEERTTRNNYLRVDRKLFLQRLEDFTHQLVPGDDSIDQVALARNADIGADLDIWTWDHRFCECEWEGRPAWVNRQFAELPYFSLSANLDYWMSMPQHKW